MYEAGPTMPLRASTCAKCELLQKRCESLKRMSKDEENKKRTQKTSNLIQEQIGTSLNHLHNSAESRQIKKSDGPCRFVGNSDDSFDNNSDDGSSDSMDEINAATLGLQDKEDPGQKPLSASESCASVQDQVQSNMYEPGRTVTHRPSTCASCDVLFNNCAILESEVMGPARKERPQKTSTQHESQEDDKFIEEQIGTSLGHLHILKKLKKNNGQFIPVRDTDDRSDNSSDDGSSDSINEDEEDDESPRRKKRRC